MHKHKVTTNPSCGLCYCDVHEGCPNVEVISRNGFAAIHCPDCRMVVDLEAVSHRIDHATAAVPAVKDEVPA